MDYRFFKYKYATQGFVVHFDGCQVSTKMSLVSQCNSVVVCVWLSLLVSFNSVYNGEAIIPTTLEGPFKPVTVPLNKTLHTYSNDLPSFPTKVKDLQPQQISVSLSANYDSLWISWITGEFQIGYNITPLDPGRVRSIVQYRVFRSNLTYQAEGYSLVYNQFYPFEGLQNYTSGIIHHVRLSDLKPDTLYQFECGDLSIPSMSYSHYFRTMPVSSPGNYPNRIAVVGDLGLTHNTTTTLSHLLSNHPDLVVLVGDLSYADLYLTNGTRKKCSSCSHLRNSIKETYQPRWDYWGRFMQPLVSNVPTMVVVGDHEIEQQAENLTFAAYSSRFAFPSEESGSSSSLYYSFNAGGIHFVVLCAYTPYEKSSDQYNWLERDLADVHREFTPWLVAAWHSPWYSTYSAHYREAECMRLEMEELLYENGVDIVFNGHVNAYERSNRVYNYSLDPCGPVYITIGTGGNREGLDITHADEPGKCPIGGFCAVNFTSGPASGKFCWEQQPDYSAFRESSFGHGILEVNNETHALWSWHRNQEFYENAGDIIYIVREPDKCFNFTKGGN